MYQSKYGAGKWIILGCLTTLLCLLSTMAFASSDPYSLTRFRSVIDDSKLQAPQSSPAQCYRDGCEGFSAWFFRLDSTGKYMTFEMEDDTDTDNLSNRCELRQLDEWQLSTPTWRKMIGEVRVFYPQTLSLEQFTFMQVHDSRQGNEGLGQSKPLIRLVWFRERQDNHGEEFDDYIWAVLRYSSGETSAYDIKPLLPRPNGFFKAEIKIKDNLLRVRINNVTASEWRDEEIDDWDGLNLYFKAGVYLQDAGRAKVQFRRLKYYE